MLTLHSADDSRGLEYRGGTVESGGARALHSKKPITRGLRTPLSSGVLMYSHGSNGRAHGGRGLEYRGGTVERGRACALHLKKPITRGLRTPLSSGVLLY